VSGSGAPGSLTIDASNDTLTLEIDDDMGSTIQRTLTLTAGTYSSVSEIVAEINTQIANDLSISGEVVAEVADNGGTDVIKIRTTDTGGTSTSLTLSGNGCANLNLDTTQVTGTDLATELNTLPFVVNDLSDGDEFNVAGINPDGTVVSATYTYAAGDTVQDLLDAINSAFSGTSATFDSSGQLVLTDSIRGESQSSITLSFEDNDSSGSVMNIPSFQVAQQGQDAGIHTASITVYDSKGDTHTVSMVFSNISTENTPNVWSWEAIIDDGDIVPSSGNKGTVRFNSDGSLGVFSVEDGQPLTFDPGNGTETMNVSLDAGDQNGFNGITQLRSPTTTVAKHQDGYAMGNLQTVSVDPTGTITGYFSNGVVQDLAQIALATFNNPSGLIRTADSLYESSANSGTPIKGAIGGGIQATINSGALEMSNVDLAHEFTNMIVAQRGFQANARVITTADNLLNEIVQLKR